MTDIELMPDGRVYVFGTSLEVLDVLNQLQTTHDDDIVSRMHQRSEINQTTDLSGREIKL